MALINIVAKKQPSYHKRTPSNVIFKGVMGVIVESDSSYVVNANNNIYLIHPICFRTKDVRKVYVKDELGRWLMYDRVCEDDRRQMPKNYYPFKTNFECIGDVIVDNGMKYFNIKVSWNPHDITMRDRMLKKYYKEE